VWPVVRDHFSEIVNATRLTCLVLVIGIPGSLRRAQQLGILGRILDTINAEADAGR
jgi:hypothetical protein